MERITVVTLNHDVDECSLFVASSTWSSTHAHNWVENCLLGQRDAATAPSVGDRVPYVIIKAAKGAKVCANFERLNSAET
jgi:hypothetical protein